MVIPMTNPRYFSPGGGQSMKGGLERWVPNGVYSLTKPRPVPPSDAELRKEYPGLQWVEVRNRSDDYCSIGECVVFDKPVLDVDYEQDVFFRGRDDVWLDGYPGGEAAKIAWDEAMTDSYDPSLRPEFSNRWSNWGIAIDPIPGTDEVTGGGTGRIAIGGVLLVPISVRHPAMRYVEARQDSDVYTLAQTTFAGNGEILWLSEHASTHPYVVSSESTEYRYAIIKLGSFPPVSFIAYIDSRIPALDITDATNPTISNGDVLPMRKGYDLNTPFGATDNKLRTHAVGWNGAEQGVNRSIKAFNYSEVDIPAGVYTTVYWDANSRCFVAMPPACDFQSFHSYYSHSSGVITWADTVASTEINLARSTSTFTADRPMRIHVEGSMHVRYGTGTAPFEAFFQMRKNGSHQDVGYINIADSGSARQQINLNTQVDLAKNDTIDFVFGPTSGTPTVSPSFGRITLERKIKPGS